MMRIRDDEIYNYNYYMNLMEKRRVYEQTLALIISPNSSSFVRSISHTHTHKMVCFWE